MPRERGRPRRRACLHREAPADVHRALTDPVAICAENHAGWHESWLAALGLRSERRGPVWLALDPPPFIYWTGITLAPEATAQQLAGARGTVCDAWASLDLEPFEFEVRLEEPWCLRPAGELPDEGAPPELEVVEVSTPDEVVEFELTGARAFVDESATVESTFHPPTILRERRMRLLTGRVDGEPVAVAMSFRDESAMGIYGVGTLASARRRGYASVLTRALIDQDLPTLLSSGPEAESLYRRLGFERVGALRQWTRVL